MSNQPRYARNQEWVRLHVEERLTLTAIGKRYGVSRERVRQVVRTYGVPSKVTRRVRSEATRESRVTHRCEVCGRVQQRYQALAEKTRTCGRSVCRGRIQRWYTRAELLTHLKALATKLGYTPTCKDLGAAAPPAHTCYYRYFGSLREAQAAAGLIPNTPGGGQGPEGLP